MIIVKLNALFFNKQLHFWGFLRLKVAWELLSNFQNFNFKKFVRNNVSFVVSTYFQNAKNTFYSNRFDFSFEIYFAVTS